jgi:hypothetical protein
MSLEQRVFDQIVTTEVNKLPKELRAEQTELLRASLNKAKAVLESVNSDDGWTERTLRTMGQQWTIWRGQPKEQPKEGK